MTEVQVLDASRDPSGGYKVDVSRGQRIGRVSSEWFSRPADERFLSLDTLRTAVQARSDHSRTHVVESALIHVQAQRDDPECQKALERDPGSACNRDPFASWVRCG